MFQNKMTATNSLSFDLPSSDEEDYTEEQFSNFLTETKEKLAKFTIKDEFPVVIENDDGKCTDEDKEVEIIAGSAENSKDERDIEFMKFLGDLKNLSAKSERSKKSFRCDSPNISQNSEIFDSFHNDSLKKPFTVKNENVPASSISEFDEKYTKLFNVSRAECGEELYKYFNKKIFDNKLPLDLELIWSSDLRSTAGTTKAKKKGNVYYNCEIALSKKVLTTYVRLRDTLLHEMCHAAVWLISQISGDNHGPLWHTWAARCKLILPNIDMPQRCHNYEISFPFYYKCSNCSWKCGRHRKSAKLAKALCPHCKTPLILIKS